MITGDPAGAFVSTLGSTLPDSVEGIGANPRKRRKVRLLNLSHRGVSHWYMVYLIPFLALLAIEWGILPPLNYIFYNLLSPNFPPANFLPSNFSLPSIFHSDFFSWQSLPPMISFFFVGACLHILGDMLCGTVPGLTPYSRRVGIRLFKVNSLKETLLVVPVSLAAIALRLMWVFDV